MAKAEKSATLDAAVVATTDVGDTIGHSDKIVDVGGASGDPKQIYVTGIYGVATTAGIFHLFQSNTTTFVAFAAGTAAHFLDVYISTTGDGITGLKLGPITEDLFLAAATAGCDAGAITVSYEVIGTE